MNMGKCKVLLVVLFLSSWFIYYRYTSVVIHVSDSFLVTVDDSMNFVSTLKARPEFKGHFLFLQFLQWKDFDPRWKSGEYRVVGDFTEKQFLRILRSGTFLIQDVAVTIPEGKTIRQIASILESRGVVASSAFEEQATRVADFTSDFEFLMNGEMTSLEGFLFPDTYFLRKNMTAKSVIYRMLHNFENKYFSLLPDKSTTDLSLWDTVRLASIVERELQNAQDRSLGADVFLKRLKIGMPLQSDATVNYVTQKSELRPSLDDLAAESPYNTYRNVGLPPGPIANPGIESLRAVLFPKKNNYYYYLSGSDGATHWAVTHEEHVQNKQLWL